MLRYRAGYPTLRPAARAIEKRTGHHLGSSTISAWEGTKGSKGTTLPRLDYLIIFLVGLGYDFTHLQGTIEEVLEQMEDPSAGFAACLRIDPDLRATVRKALLELPAVKRKRAKDAIAYLDRMDDVKNK
ncbi:MAG: hypothetical protein D6696_15650 [Acidobacteria bacterium]|nr:MAG: hypothetical protein D6696_15650 [Acidobacteriota bacterium]